VQLLAPSLLVAGSRVKVGGVELHSEFPSSRELCEPCSLGVKLDCWSRSLILSLILGWGTDACNIQQIHKGPAEMAKLPTVADHSFAALDAVYAREGGTGVLELGGASDARIVVWANIRGLRLAEFEERKQEAMASSAVISAFRYLHTGLAPRIIGELLGPSDRRVMRIVSRKWRAHLDKPGWRAEEARQEERLIKLAAGVQDLTRLLQGGVWVYRILPRGGWRGLYRARDVVHKTVQERVCALHDELEAGFAEYAGGRAPLVAGLVRSVERWLASDNASGPGPTPEESPSLVLEEYGWWRRPEGSCLPPFQTPSPATGTASTLGVFIKATWRRLSQRGVQSRLGGAPAPHLGISIGSIEVPQEGAARTLFDELVDVRKRLAAVRRQVEERQALVAQEDRQLVDAADPTDPAVRWLSQSTYYFLVRARQSVADLEEQERAIQEVLLVQEQEQEALVHAAVQEVLDAAGPRSSFASTSTST
jgi:hypothetical protein